MGLTGGFVPVRIAVLTVSDTRTSETDSSGAWLGGAIEVAGHVLVARAIVPDDKARIAAAVQGWIDDPAVDAVITTGGTGLTGRDVTPITTWRCGPTRDVRPGGAARSWRRWRSSGP